MPAKQARYYDPQIQRFVSEDPIGFSSGDFNWYRYVWDSPVYLMDPYGEFAFVAIPWIIEGAEWVYAGYRAYRAYKAAKTAYDIAKSFPVYDDASGNVCYAKLVDKNKKPDHPDFVPHKKKKGLRKIPWNKNRKRWPAKDGSYWEPVPDGHRGTHDPH